MISSRGARLAVAAAAAVSLLVSACDDGRAGGNDRGPLGVVAAFYPLAEAAARVGGDRVEVVNLTPPGAEPHDVEVTSRQVDRIEDAAVVFYLGGDFQPAVEEVARRVGGVDVLAALADRSDAVAGAGDETDPHVWLDPELMIDIVEIVEAELTRRSPADAGAFAANARAYRAELAALGEEFAAGLARCDRRLLVTSHAAYGYLARRYGLDQEALAGTSPESEPSPERLAELADLIRARGVTTVFTEPLAPPRIAEALAREAGVTIAELNPLEALTDEELARGESYVTVMRANLAALRDGLGCSSAR